jgi:hypothetical protein
MIHPLSLTLLLYLCGVAVTPLAIAGTTYFPISKSDKEPGLSASRAEWYSKYLTTMEEPSLIDATNDPQRRVYRLTILPTWGNSIAVRFEETGASYRLSSKRLDRQGGAYDPGKLAESKDLTLNKEDSKTLAALIADLRYFAMATQDRVSGFDGDRWILEGVSDQKYHVIERWCASSEQTKERGLEPFIALCRFLITKSGLSERPKNRGHEILP